MHIIFKFSDDFLSCRCSLSRSQNKHCASVNKPKPHISVFKWEFVCACIHVRMHTYHVLFASMIQYNYILHIHDRIQYSKLFSHGHASCMHSYSKNGRPSLGYSIIVLAWLKKEDDSRSAHLATCRFGTSVMLFSKANSLQLVSDDSAGTRTPLVGLTFALDNACSRVMSVSFCIRAVIFSRCHPCIWSTILYSMIISVSCM